MQASPTGSMRDLLTPVAVSPRGRGGASASSTGAKAQLGSPGAKLFDYGYDVTDVAKLKDYLEKGGDPNYVPRLNAVNVRFVAYAVPGGN